MYGCYSLSIFCEQGNIQMQLQLAYIEERDSTAFGYNAALTEFALAGDCDKQLRAALIKRITGFLPIYAGIRQSPSQNLTHISSQVGNMTPKSVHMRA